MAKKITITAGKKVISIESDDAGVPDVTKDAGPDLLKLQNDAMAAPNEENAEFNAAQPDSQVESEDKPQEAETANEAYVIAKDNDDTFYGLVMAVRANEGFGISDAFSGLKFKTKDEMFKDPKVNAAINTAKEWAAKKGYEMASVKEVQENKQTLGTLLFSRAGKVNVTDGAVRAITKMQLREVNGAVVSVMEADMSIANALTGYVGALWAIVRKLSGRGLLLSFVWFKKPDGKVFCKGLAKAVWTKADAIPVASESLNLDVGEFTASKYLKSSESDDEPAAQAAGEEPAQSDNPVTPDETTAAPAEETPATEPAAEETPAEETPAEDGAGTVTEGDGVTTIDTGDTVITITDTDKAAAPAPAPAEETPATEPAAEETPAEGAENAPAEPAAPEQNTDQAIESFFKNLGL